MKPQARVCFRIKNHGDEKFSLSRKGLVIASETQRTGRIFKRRLVVAAIGSSPRGCGEASPLEWRYLAISSTYVERRCGVLDAGFKLLSTAIEEARRAGVAKLLGFVSAKNRASIRLAKRTGWEKCGTIPERSRGPVRMEFQLWVLTFNDRKIALHDSQARRQFC